MPSSPLFPKEFHDIGIRIEDDVLVGSDYPTVLSVNAPKEVRALWAGIRVVFPLSRPRFQIADVEGACQGLLGLEAF